MNPLKVLFANQKGGVGKTTTCRELSICIASKGKRILVVDLDPQANLSKSLIEPLSKGLYEALLGNEFELKEVTLRQDSVQESNLYLLSGNKKLAGLEKSFIGDVDAYLKLKDLFATDCFQQFDYIFIDSPPTLSLLTLNGLVCADYLIIPMNPSLYSLQGTNDLLETISKVKKSFNPDLSIAGVIINAFDSVPTITREIKAEINEAFGSKVFSTSISKSIKIEKAIESKKGIGEFNSKLADEINIIADELIERLGGNYDKEIKR